MRRHGFRNLLFVLGVVAGSLVIPTPADARQPAPESGSSDWVQLAVGGSFACGIRTSGRLMCWGDNDDGQIGRGTMTAQYSTPAEVNPGVTTWRSVSAGTDHACGIRTSGRLYCWGGNINGAVGNPAAAAAQRSPIEVAGGTTNWTAVEAGNGHTCALRSTGRLYCWGYDVQGQLGTGANHANRLTPALVSGGFTDWTAFSAGGFHTCARRRSGRLYCWGDDLFGELGDNAVESNKSVPTPVAGGTADWTSVSAESFHTCGRRTSGRLYCWGDNSTGSLGAGVPDPELHTPVQVAGGATNWTSVSVGEHHACGRRSSGRLYCWGQDDAGQVGDDGDNADQLTPNLVASGATDWAAVAAGDGFTCARNNGHHVYCWGYDGQGQLGNGGANTNAQRPEEIFVA